MSSYIPVSAHSNTENIFYSAKNFTVLDFAIAGRIQDRTVSFNNKPDTFYTERQNAELDEYIIEIEEKEVEEDDELISFNKYLHRSSYADFISTDQAKYLYDYFSYSSSNRYLLFQVFRIWNRICLDKLIV